MHKMHRLGVVALAVLFSVGLMAAAAQAPNPLEGQLDSVDPDAMTFVVVADGQAWEIAYTAETQVTGAGESTEGLAAATGQRVRVEWDENGTATKIAILG